VASSKLAKEFSPISPGSMIAGSGSKLGGRIGVNGVLPDIDG
jgi:hypothetical protein